MSLRHALHTLSAIRNRYEAGRSAYPDARFYSVHVAVDQSDVAWITATIEALKRTIAAEAIEPAEAEPQARLEM